MLHFKKLKITIVLAYFTFRQRVVFWIMVLEGVKYPIDEWSMEIPQKQTDQHLTIVHSKQLIQLHYSLLLTLEMVQLVYYY